MRLASDGNVSIARGQDLRAQMKMEDEPSEGVLKFFRERGISEEVVIRFSIGSGDHRELGRCITFPYYANGSKVAVKYRNKNKQFSQQGSCATTFMNVECIADEGLSEMPLIITEGEIDMLSVIEVGHDRVVGFGAGAPTKITAWPIPDFDDKRYAALYANKDDLAKIKQIILMTDADEAGRYLNIDLRRRLGEYRCYSVIYPEDCKDANDVLMKHGKDALRRVIQNAQPCPMPNIKKISEYPELAPPQTFDTGWPWADEHLQLFKPELMVVTGVPSHGKALALDTEVATTSGWKTMGDIRVGDWVFDSNGSPTMVQWISEIHEDRKCYKIIFDDKTEIVADADHEWVVKDNAYSTRTGVNYKKVTTQFIFENQKANDGRNRFAIKNTCLYGGDGPFIDGPLAGKMIINVGEEFWPRIPPYCLGVWLGDGTSSTGEFTCFDEEIVENFKKAWIYGGVKKLKTEGRYSADHLRHLLQASNLIDNKHIPEEYLRLGSAERLALLRGLMDTDGFVHEDQGICEITSVNEKLSQQILELVNSLGMKGRLTTGEATIDGEYISEKYRVSFIPNFNVCALSRKSERIKSKYSGKSLHRTIVSVEETETVPVRCIGVESDTHEFLVTRSFIRTHNSTVVNALCFNLAIRHRFKIAMSSLEMPPVPYFRDGARRYITDTYGYTISESDKILNNSFLFIDPDETEEEPTLDWYLDRVNMAWLRHGIDMMVLDPWNELFHDWRGQGYGSFTEYVGEAIKEIKRFVRRRDMIGCIVAHPSKMNEKGRINKPSLYDISDSAHFYNKCDHGIVIWRVNNSGDIDMDVQKSRFSVFGGRPGIIKFNMKNYGRLDERIDDDGDDIDTSHGYTQ